MLSTKRRPSFWGVPFLWVLVLAVYAVGAGKRDFPTQAELDAITDRGRLLAEYDTASWYATDAVFALKPSRFDRPLHRQAHGERLGRCIWQNK